MLSIITIVYQDAKFIESTLKNIIEQKNENVQFIVIDGGSTDGTVDIINKYSDKIDIFVSEPDCGIYDAMNKGWNLAIDNNYIIFANSGDLLEPGAVDDFFVELESTNHKYDIYHGRLNFFYNSCFLYSQGRSSLLLDKKMIEHPASFVHKKVFNVLNGFELKYKLSSDYDFILRARKKEFTFKYFDKVISNFNLDGASSNGIKGGLESLEIRYKENIISRKEYFFRSGYLRLSDFFKRVFFR